MHLLPSAYQPSSGQRPPWRRVSLGASRGGDEDIDYLRVRGGHFTGVGEDWRGRGLLLMRGPGRQWVLLSVTFPTNAGSYI